MFVYAPDGDGLFAAVTAVFERMRLSVLDARIVTSKSGMGMDNFLVLDANSRVLDAGTVERLRRTLEETLKQNPYPVSVGAQRPLSRLKHFQIPTRIEFRDDAQSGRTQLALVCSDSPGLLAAVAQVFRVRRLRVHDARIATNAQRCAPRSPNASRRRSRLRPRLRRSTASPSERWRVAACARRRSESFSTPSKLRLLRSGAALDSNARAACARDAHPEVSYAIP